MYGGTGVETRIKRLGESICVVVRNGSLFVGGREMRWLGGGGGGERKRALLRSGCLAL